MASQTLLTVSQEERQRALEFSQMIYELDQRSERASAELNKAKQIAKSMKLDNISIDIISKYTELPFAEVAAL